MNQNQSLLDEGKYLHHVREWIQEGETNASIVQRLAEELNFATTKDSIRRFRKRHGLMPPAAANTTASGTTVKVDGDDAEIRVQAHIGPHTDEWRYLDDPDKMLRERGLDPANWQIDGATVNEWDMMGKDGGLLTHHQAKLHLKRTKSSQIFAARSDGWKAPPRRRVEEGGTRLIVVTGDQQIPFHDEELHYLFCGWLEHNRPSGAVALGDKVDFPNISKYRLDPDNTAYVNECIQGGYEVFRDYRIASPDTEWDFLPGNHDERIRNLILDKPSVQPLHGLRQASTDEGEGAEVMSLPHLLRLDELGINFHDPRGPYDLAQVNVAPKLAVRHGWIASKGSGSSALKTLEHLGYSVVVGHTHRQSIVYKTTHDIDGVGTTTLTAAEAGCMCRISQARIGDRKFPSFAPAADWQQGFSTVTVHPDGLFRIENATYVNGTLLWRGQSYKA